MLAVVAAPVVVLGALNILFAEHGTVLKFHDDGCRGSLVCETVGNTDGYIDTLPDAKRELLLADEHRGLAVGNNPVFGAVMMTLERKALTRQDFDALEHGMRKDFEDAP